MPQDHPLFPPFLSQPSRQPLGRRLAAWYEARRAASQRRREQAHPLWWESERLRREAINAADAATLEPLVRVDFDHLAEARLEEVLTGEGASEELGAYTRAQLAAQLERRREGISAARFEPGYDSGNLRRVKIVIGDDQVGILGYRICEDCQVGQLAKLSIGSPYRRGGLGRKAIEYLMALHPGVRWVTTGQYVPARGFWSQMARETGAGWTAGDMPCKHARD